MPRYLAAVLALLLGGQAAKAFGPTNVTLAQLQPQYRVLLIFPGKQDPSSIVHSLEQVRDAMRNREVVWFIIGSSLIANAPYTFDNAYRTQLIQRYGPTPDKASLVLIGKDGSIKLHEDGALDLKHVFEFIDRLNGTTMPAEAGK